MIILVVASSFFTQQSSYVVPLSRNEVTSSPSGCISLICVISPREVQGFTAWFENGSTESRGVNNYKSSGHTHPAADTNVIQVLFMIHHDYETGTFGDAATSHKVMKMRTQ